MGAWGLQGTCLRISLEDGCLLAEVAHRGVSMRRQDLDPNLISPGFAQLLSLDRPVAVLVLPLLNKNQLCRVASPAPAGGLCASEASAGAGRSMRVLAWSCSPVRAAVSLVHRTLQGTCSPCKLPCSQ